MKRALNIKNFPGIEHAPPWISLDLSNYEIFPHKILKSRTFKKSSILIVIFTLGVKGRMINPSLHTTWLKNHALTLKKNTAKYYFGEKSRIMHTVLKFCPESRKI
jgi:hypothetical protein